MSRHTDCSLRIIPVYYGMSLIFLVLSSLDNIVLNKVTEHPHRMFAYCANEKINIQGEKKKKDL